MYVEREVPLTRRQVAVQSDEIASVTLYRRRPLAVHVYALPLLSLYPLLAFAYFVKYDEWIKSEEWTFVYTAALGVVHALSFLVTRWSVRMRALITAAPVRVLATPPPLTPDRLAQRSRGRACPSGRPQGRRRDGSAREADQAQRQDGVLLRLPRGQVRARDARCEGACHRCDRVARFP